MKKVIGWFILSFVVGCLITILASLVGLIPAAVLIGGSISIAGLIYLGVTLVES